MRFGVAVLVGVVMTTVLVVGGAPDGETANSDSEDVVAAPTQCERYGGAFDRIIEARRPKPERSRLQGLIADDSGYTGITAYPYYIFIGCIAWHHCFY